MLANLGQALVLAGLGSATAGALAGFAAGWWRSADAWAWARRLAYAFGACMLLANLVMEYALITHDFSVKYVAQVGSTTTPLHITIVSLWSSLEGSILFWGLILGVYVALATWRNGDRNAETMPWATAVWLAVGTFFCFLLAGPANPWVPGPVPVPTDGPGPNPLLQNHLLMIVHPPFLYLGYVGMTIPFGIAAGALISGRLGASQLAPLRTWLLAPWMFLTVGIVLGGWWAYEVLGWGGYWAWDPVENASLLPWLTATAGLHAAMLPHRRGSLKGWTVTLVMASFLLTLLGTFMTRSGVFNSVHAFSQSDIGPTLLAFIAVCLVFTVVLLAARIDKLESEGAIDAPVSRETAFLVNNLLFVALTFTVLIGTVFPLLAEAIKGVKLSVGEPYFNRMAIPVGVAILFLMGVGPALPWGEASPNRIKTHVVPPLVVGLVTAAVGFAAGVREPWPLITLLCAGFATVVTLRELVTPFAAKAGSFASALYTYRKRTGGYLVHLGIVVMIVAIAMSSAFRVDEEFRLDKGECHAFQGYDLCYVGKQVIEEPNRTQNVAEIRVNGEFTMGPALVDYPAMMTPIGTPAVHTTPTHDLYLSLMNMDKAGAQVAIHAFRNPLIVWLWIGSGIAVLGACVALVPARRSQAAFAAPTAAAEATGK